MAMKSIEDWIEDLKAIEDRSWSFEEDDSLKIVEVWRLCEDQVEDPWRQWNLKVELIKEAEA